MRTMITIRIPVQAGNRAVREGKIGQVINGFVTQHKPEATYFATRDGQRTMTAVFDLKDPSQVPMIAEPFFMELDAAVDFQPVMNLEDLQKGLSSMK